MILTELRPNQGLGSMSTKMDENDWVHTLAVFRACLPRRGRNTEDDRRFLEALHFFTVENGRWRALPECFGPSSSVRRRFDRLSKCGVFEAFFDALASMSSTAHLLQMFDFTVLRAHVSAAARRASAQAVAWRLHHENPRKIGRLRGYHRLRPDRRRSLRRASLRNPPEFWGEVQPPASLKGLDIGPDIQPRAVICDKGYASKADRDAARPRRIRLSGLPRLRRPRRRGPGQGLVR